MKAILMSVQPQWVQKILSGEKTVELRKSKPAFALDYTDYALETEGIDVYCYCTKSKPDLWAWRCLPSDNPIFETGDINNVFFGETIQFNGKVPCKFTLRKVTEIGHIVEGVALDDNYEYSLNGDSSLSIADYLKKAGLTVYESLRYKGNSKNLYGWHIDDLQVFDKPMELGDFNKCDGFSDCFNCKHYPQSNNDGIGCKFRKLTRAPQSWQYIEV
jgi:predicted transcriptional regulator